MPQISIQYPGVVAPKSCYYTLSQGVDPDVAVLTCVAQPSTWARNGTLRLSDGINTLNLTDCLAIRSSTRMTIRGFVTTIYLMDRRWRWVNAEPIHGCWNVRYPDGVEIVPSTIQTMAQLMERCFNQLGESLYDLTLVPNNVFHEVRWSFDSPADALEELLEAAGCVLALGIDNVFYVVPIGYGGALPTTGRVRVLDTGVSGPPSPGFVTVVAGETWFQAKLALTAQVLDPNSRGVPQLIDLDDWDQNPNGRGSTYSGSGTGAENSSATTAENTAAANSKFRFYKITGFANGSVKNSLNLDGIQLARIDQILPVSRRLFDSTVTDSTSGQFWKQSAYVEGKHAAKNPTSGNSGTDAQVETGFELDEQLGLVIFDEPVYKYNSNGAEEAADLWLTCTFRMRSDNTLDPSSPGLPSNFLRYAQILPVPGGLHGTKVVERSDLNARYRYDYTWTGIGPTISDSSDNVSYIAGDLQQTALGQLGRYQDVLSQTGEYGGIQPIGLTGRIRQVSYQVDMQDGAVTHAALNGLVSPLLLGPRFRADHRRAHAFARLQRSRLRTLRKLDLEEGNQ